VGDPHGGRQPVKCVGTARDYDQIAAVGGGQICSPMPLDAPVTIATWYAWRMTG
jgi:hypothetical protein